MFGFPRAYAWGLAFVVFMAVPVAAALLLGGWLWVQGLLFRVLGRVFSPCRPMAKWCFTASEWVMKPIMLTFDFFDRRAFPDEFPTNLDRSETIIATDTEAREMT